MEITYTTEDGSIEVRLLYIVKRRLRNYPGIGKSWPKHTQCLCFLNGLMHSFGEVVKHEKDPDNQAYAFKKATEIAVEEINLKHVRSELWVKVRQGIKDGTLTDK